MQMQIVLSTYLFTYGVAMQIVLSTYLFTYGVAMQNSSLYI